MDNTSDLIEKITSEDADLSKILEGITELTEFFDSVEEMNNYYDFVAPGSNSATVNISFSQSPLSSTKWGINEQKP